MYGLIWSMTRLCLENIYHWNSSSIDWILNERIKLHLKIKPSATSYLRFAAGTGASIHDDRRAVTVVQFPRLIVHAAIFRVRVLFFGTSNSVPIVTLIVFCFSLTFIIILLEINSENNETAHYIISMLRK